MINPSQEVVDARALGAKCNVCQLGYQVMMRVNRMIAGGSPYSDVFRMLSRMYEKGEIKSRPSYDSVRAHGKRHLPIRDDATRRLLERHAIDAGLEIDGEHVESLIQPIVVAEETMRLGFQLMANRKLEPTVKEMLEASKIVNQHLRASRQNVEITDALNQVTEILRVVQEVVPPEYWPMIAARLNTIGSPNPEVFRVQIDDAELVETDRDY